MQSLLEYIIKVSKSAVLRPFRLLYRQIKKRLFLKNRIGRFIKGAVKGAQKSAMNKPNSKEAYVKMGHRFLSKRLLVILVLLLVLLPVIFASYMLPLLAGKLFTPTYAITDTRLKGFTGSVNLTALTGRVLYNGQMQDGLASGIGTLYDKEGNIRYEGSFLEDNYDGYGTLYDEGLLLYEGEFSAGTFEGNGKAYYPNGEVAYEGGFSAGAYSGEGSLYRADGSLKYKGGFSAGLYNGYGTEQNSDGAKQYEGSYEMGKRSGKGTSYSDLGNKLYLGTFSENMPSGEGTLLHENGRLRYKGAFASGKFEGSGKLYTEESKLIYEGNFSEGQYSGQGYLYRPNGRVFYDGLFKEGKFEGEGKLYGTLGNALYSGLFHSGEFDIVPLIGSPLNVLGERFTVTPVLVEDATPEAESYVVDYTDFMFAVRANNSENGPIIDGFIFYGAQNYLDIRDVSSPVFEMSGTGSENESSANQASSVNQTIQTSQTSQTSLLSLQESSSDSNSVSNIITETGVGAGMSAETTSSTINPYDDYKWIMDKTSPLLDKDGSTEYGYEKYVYEGLSIAVIRNKTSNEILIYEIGVTANE